MDVFVAERASRGLRLEPDQLFTRPRIRFLVAVKTRDLAMLPDEAKIRAIVVE